MVKNLGQLAEQPVDQVGTRERVVDLLVNGPATATQLGRELGLSPAAIRRHLDALLAERRVTTRDEVRRGRRGRGRPARVFVLTERGRAGLQHTYDDLAAAALRWIAERDGAQAVADFAAAQVVDLEERCESAVHDSGEDPLARAAALAGALTAQGYAASATAIASGGQLCQHHCPVAHVAAEFPQLCEAETEVISRLVGTHVQRLATIAHGDGVCTTHIPPRPARVPPGAGVPAPADRRGSTTDRPNAPSTMTAATTTASTTTVSTTTTDAAGLADGGTMRTDS